MSASQPTAAEKAEARRLKILAKKNARMAYAAGDRSKLPSTAPDEPIVQPPILLVNQENPQVAGVAGSEDVSPGNVDISGTAQSAGFSAPTAFVPLNAQPAYPGLARSPAMKRSLLAGSRWLRILFVACSAMLFAAVMYAELIPLWQFSAMHVFAAVEMCVFAPHLLGRISPQGISRRGGSVPGSLGALGLLLSATQYASMANQLAQDFSVFMLAFLCTWYVLTYV